MKMNKNEKTLAVALCTAIKEVNFLADMLSENHSEATSIDLLDRLEAGLLTGDIQLKAKGSMFANGRLCWPPPIKS